jgi:hypothetical protein
MLAAMMRKMTVAVGTVKRIDGSICRSQRITSDPIQMMVARTSETTSIGRLAPRQNRRIATPPKMSTIKVISDGIQSDISFTSRAYNGLGVSPLAVGSNA